MPVTCKYISKSFFGGAAPNNSVSHEASYRREIVRLRLHLLIMANLTQVASEVPLAAQLDALFKRSLYKLAADLATGELLTRVWL